MDGRGVPLSLIVTAANVNDGTRINEVLSAIVIERERTPMRRNKHLCADAGYRGAENVRIIEATAKHSGISMDKVYVNVDRYGNTSSASIPIALNEAIESGKVKDGSTVMMVAFGAGFTWASMIIRF